MEEIILTQEGLDKLKQELAERLERRKKIASKIEYAKSLGDLSENFEYQEAKEDQSFNETRLMELESLIKRAVVSERSDSNNVQLGSTITVTTDGQDKQFTIVSFNEADPAAGKISNESPLGRNFMGRMVGETVEVKVPKGIITYQIKDIQ